MTLRPLFQHDSCLEGSHTLCFDLWAGYPLGGGSTSASGSN